MEAMEDILVIVGLIGVQFLYAGTSILLGYFLKLGLQPFDLIIFANSATFLVLFPLSISFERRKWPKTIAYSLACELFLLSFGGVTVYQSLLMKGVTLTSPTMATAMPNLVPGLVFPIAWVFGLEKLKLGCRYTRAKIAGTLLCVFGAILMSLMQSSTSLRGNEAKAEITGCFYLIASVFVLSLQVVLQAITLSHFPAPMSLCSIISVLGVAITVLIRMVSDRMSLPKWPSVAAIDNIILYSMLTGVLGGLCVSFNTWAVKKQGPVVVSIFNPLATVLSATFSAISWGESIAIGSYGGMLLMFIGLYMVLWAKRNEEYEESKIVPLSNEDDDGTQRPLLC